MPTTEIRIDPDIELMLSDLSETLRPRRLILFNDDEHDMLEVIVQIIRARNAAGKPCTAEEAKAIMLEAHTRGEALVMGGPVEPLRRARETLESIELRCDIVD
jgi:ATP-dependent Clp protease adapter protein ClpS